MFEDFQKSIRVMRLPSPAHDTITGFAHYFPMSLLPDMFWDEMALNPSFRITDGAMNEIPIHVLDLDVPGKTGSLWFRADKPDTAKAYFIHYDSPTSVGFDHGGPYGSQAVWSSYNDAIMLNEDMAGGQVLNQVNSNIGSPFSIDGTFVGTQVDSVLEMKATRFFDTKEHRISFGDGTMDVSFNPMTFIFLFKLNELPSAIEHIMGNWRDGFPAEQFYRLIITPNSLGFQSGGLFGGSMNMTDMNQFDDMAVDTWFLGVLCYNFDLGIVEVDINKTNRVLNYSQADPFFAEPSGVRTVGGLGSDSSNLTLSVLLNYTGYLNKEQRDVIFDHYFTPEDIWRIMAVPGSAICFSSQMEKNICLSSHMNEEVCFTSKLKG